MKFESHLSLVEDHLAPSTEWAVSVPGWCFLRVSQGHAYWLGPQRTRELGPGDVLIFASAAKGNLRASQIAICSFHYFCFCPELLSGLLTLSERYQLETLCRNPKSSVRVLKADEPVAGEFALLCNARPARTGFARRCQMLELVACLLRGESTRPHLPAGRSPSAHDRFLNLITQVPEAEWIRQTPEELASRCHCSARHFGRLFQKRFGVSIRQKQAELRVRVAEQMLQESALSIAQVGSQVGFPSLQVFIAAFQRIHGETPGQWRAQRMTQLLQTHDPVSTDSAERSPNAGAQV